MVIFRSFQQSVEEIYYLRHFRQEYVALFNRTAFCQLKDAASAVLTSEKSTSLAELFSVELKFTIDVLNDWFSNITKPKFLDVNGIKKQIYIKENPIVPSKTTCSIYGFLLGVQARGEYKRWYDFRVECEYLFLRNIYNDTELQKMKIEDIEKYYEILDRLAELFPVVERALEDGDTWAEFEDFMLEELDDIYSTVNEMKEDIDNIAVAKKTICKPPDFSDKIISFIYSALIKFVETDKVKGIPMSEKFHRKPKRDYEK